MGSGSRCRSAQSAAKSPTQFRDLRRDSNLFSGCPLERGAPPGFGESEDPSHAVEMLGQTERGHRGQPSNPSALPGSVQRLAGILDQENASAIADFEKPVHSVRHSVEVGSQDTSQRLPGVLVYSLRVQVAGLRIERSEDRGQPRREHGEEDHIVVDGGHQQPVAGSQPLAESEEEREAPGGKVEGFTFVSKGEIALDCLRGGAHPSPPPRRAAICRACRILRHERRRSRLRCSHAGDRSRPQSLSRRTPAVAANASAPAGPGAPIRTRSMK